MKNEEWSCCFLILNSSFFISLFFIIIREVNTRQEPCIFMQDFYADDFFINHPVIGMKTKRYSTRFQRIGYVIR